MQRNNYMLICVGAGLAIGGGAGVLLNNIPFGVAVGLVMGVVIGAILIRRQQ